MKLIAVDTKWYELDCDVDVSLVQEAWCRTSHLISVREVSALPVTILSLNKLLMKYPRRIV